MAAEAPGLRAIASAEAATALACARPQRPEAIAMAKPDVMATHFLASSAPLVCANIGLANTNRASAIRYVLIFTRVAPLINSPQEVVPVILLQPGSHWSG